MSAVVADLDGSSTPSTGAGEGGGVETNEGTPESNEQHGSNVVDVAGTSTGGVPVLSAKPVYGKDGVVAELADDIVDAVDAFPVPTGFVRKGSRFDSFMYSLGVYVEQSAGTKHKFYCLAGGECRRKRKEIPCPRGDRSNVNTHLLKKKHSLKDIPVIAAKDIKTCLPPRFNGGDADLAAAEAAFDVIENTKNSDIGL